MSAAAEPQLPPVPGMPATAPGMRDEGRRDPVDYVTDWYLPQKDFRLGFIYPGPVPIAEHPMLFDMATALLKRAVERTELGYDEFVVREGQRTYRGHRILTIDGYFYALRRLPDHVPSLNNLGVPEGVTNVLTHPWLKTGGLIIVCGETGQGKSTTCAAVVKERMIQHGSFCLTVEDPPEMPLHGQHGKGRCLQTEVKSGDFAAAMRGAMRCYPTIRGSLLYVGETRDAETAAEVLRVATNGHLVLTTLHAQDLMSAVSRFNSLAASVMALTEVQSIFASSFRLGMHQKLDEVRSSSGTRRKLSVSFLISDGHTSSVANSIRRGELTNLGNDIDMQKRTLENKGVKALLDLWKN